MPLADIKRTSLPPFRLDDTLPAKQLASPTLHPRLQLSKRYPRGGPPETITVRLDSERLVARQNGADEALLECSAFGIAVTL